MGVIYESRVRLKLSPERVERDLEALNEELWPDLTYQVRKVASRVLQG